MDPYIDKIKDWYKNLTVSKISYEKRGINPKADWIKIISLMQIFILAIVAFSFYFYLKIDKGEFFGVEIDNTENEAKINKNLLDKAIQDLNDRETNFNQAKADRVVPPNPSI